MNLHPILYAEDNEDDVFLLQDAFERAGISNRLIVVRDGQAAIEYLAGTGDFADRAKHPLPCLAVLDLKMPRRTGLEVLGWIRGQAGWRWLPVIMFTSSAHHRDVRHAYDLGVNAFLVKPLSVKVRADVCRALKHFWLSYNETPPHCGETAGGSANSDM